VSGVAGLLLAPGASATRESPALVAVEAAVAPLPVVRIDLPSGRTPSVIVQTVVEEAEAFAAGLGVGTDALVLGGRSMGGRMCSMAVAEGLPAAGLVLMSYPLHPPGRPEKLRVEHLPDVRVPCLFLSGTRDPFGTPDELTAATARIGGPVTHQWLDGVGHAPRAHAAVAAVVADWVAGLSS
jgi:predicted alpha/beta-hydrolase family hydrolase